MLPMLAVDIDLLAYPTTDSAPRVHVRGLRLLIQSARLAFSQSCLDPTSDCGKDLGGAFVLESVGLANIGSLELFRELCEYVAPVDSSAATSTSGTRRPRRAPTFFLTLAPPRPAIRPRASSSRLRRAQLLFMARMSVRSLDRTEPAWRCTWAKPVELTPLAILRCRRWPAISACALRHSR